MSTYSVEKHMRIYNDTTGTYIEVRPDSDGLDCLEIVSSETKDMITITKEEARLMIGVFQEILRE